MVQLDLRSVDIFRAVAQSGSATEAAQALGTTQPTVTRAIAEFELACGLKLFDRGRFGMRLTAEGQVLLESVQRSFAGLKAIADTVEGIRAGAFGSLSLVTIPALGEGIFADLLGEFLGAQPNVRVTLDLATPTAIVSAIANDRADFAAIAGPVPQELSCEALPMARARLELVVGANDPLAGRNVVDLADLGGRDMALLRPPNLLRSIVDTALFNIGVKPRLAHEATTQRIVAGLAASGRCIGFVDSHIAATLDRRRVALVPLKQQIGWEINLVWRRDPTAVMRTFLDWLAARSAVERLELPA